MRNGTPIRRSPTKRIEILLGTRLQAESGTSHRKQRPGALSSRYTKSLPLVSRDAVPGRSSLTSPDAVPTKPAPSARHSASPGRKAWVNQKTCVSTFCAASPAQAFCPARLAIFQTQISVRPSLPASVPRDVKINRQPELIESRVSRSKQSPLPKINRQLSCPACPDEGRESATRWRSNGSGDLLAQPAIFANPEFLIKTPSRIEIPVSARKQRTGAFLIETRSMCFENPDFSAREGVHSNKMRPFQLLNLRGGAGERSVGLGCLYLVRRWRTLSLRSFPSTVLPSRRARAALITAPICFSESAPASAIASSMAWVTS